LARIYPNGSADVNHFAAAGGMGFLIAELLGAGLLHADVQTVMGPGLASYATEPWLNPEQAGSLTWRASPAASGDEDVLRPMSRPFSLDGGLKLLQGNIGRAVIKTSAVAEKHRRVRAPAVVVNDQKELLQLFKDGQLERDFVAVVRFQGPKANGMPELHKLTPVLAVLQDKGFKVALVTDGRMSGASGKVPAAIHVSPEALSGGMIGKIRDGDIIELDANTNRLHVGVSDDELARRTTPALDLSHNQHGTGRDLFALFRQKAGAAEEGASPLFQ
jgi:phosphogluconate dehydratase